jgi:Asp-tRNA(Asn)/Glu-tRNA(Gln) amidotransferase A subunit family amidase
VTDLRNLTTREAARQIAERRLTAEALIAAYFDRIEARESGLAPGNTWIGSGRSRQRTSVTPSRRVGRFTGSRSLLRI